MTIEVNTDNNEVVIEVETQSVEPSIDVVPNQDSQSNIETYPLYGPTGNGIVSIEKTGTSGLVDTYTVTYTNGNTDTFTVTNGEKGEQGIQGIQGDTGNGIVGTEKTSTVDNVDTYTITYTNGDTDTFTVTNAKTSFEYTQAVASDTWDITHNLNKYPTPICVDSTGAVFEAAWEYPFIQGSETELDKNRIIIRMNGATTGKAFLN